MRISADLKYDMDVETIDASSELEVASTPTPNSALRAIACLLGKQAAAHFHRYRFEGLGRLELLRLQDEARARSNNSVDYSIKSINTS